MTPAGRCPLYLFYGTQVDAILRARDEIVAQALPGEARQANLIDFSPSTPGGKVSLAEVFHELAGDLETLSLLPDAPKCAVVTNPAEIFGGGGRTQGTTGGRKRTAGRLDAVLDWLERRLPATPHTVILLAFEDETAPLEVDTRSPLFQLAGRLGQMRRFAPSAKAFFRIEAALLARDVDGCLRAVHELWASPKGQMPAYQSILRTLRFLMQANIERERRDGSQAAALFPAAAAYNLALAPESVQRRYRARPIFRTQDLVEAYTSLLAVYRAMRPRPDDRYVPDPLRLLEPLLVRLLTAPRPRGA